MALKHKRAGVSKIMNPSCDSRISTAPLCQTLIQLLSIYLILYSELYTAFLEEVGTLNFVLIITVGLWGVGASVSSEISTNRSWEKTNVRTSRRIRLKMK